VNFAVRLRKIGIKVSDRTSDINLYAVVGLYSAKHGYPYGQGKKRLIEIAHHIAGSYKHNLTWFMHAVSHYGRLESMQSEGNPELWKKKLDRCRAEYKLDPTPFEPDRTSQRLVEFLFPELLPLP
jgi:hypothetical protein